MKRSHIFFPAFSALLLVSAALTAHAHGGEDHSHDNEPAAKTAPAAPAGDASREPPARLPDGQVFMPKPVQRQLAIRTQRVAVGALSAQVELNGRVVADPGAGGRVQAVQAGTVMAAAGGRFPVLGQRVRQGDVLAVLRPATAAFERGERVAQQAELNAQLQIAERRVTRLEQLEGSVPAREIEAARVELQSLRERRRALAASLDASQRLVAPVSGVVSAVEVAAGSVVDAQALLFEVIDPARLMVEAPVYDLSLPARLVSAEGEAQGRTVKLQPAGSGQMLREQALPMRFRISASDAALAVGQPVRVIARTKASAEGMAVPADALVRDANGQPIVWVHTDPELFEPRRVLHEPLDATRVVVRSGLKAGERVVVQGATLLSQVR
jgi:RND family efflux transporter MFP subunit